MLIEGTVRMCALCRTVLDIPAGVEPHSVIEGRAGQPNVRILLVDGKEIHRCEVHNVAAD